VVKSPTRCLSGNMAEYDDPRARLAESQVLSILEGLRPAGGAKGKPLLPEEVLSAVDVAAQLLSGGSPKPDA
jgi:hypothetical protein